MKKIILVVLMAAMVAIPCFAQEAEPDKIFSIDGTIWDSCSKGFSSEPPFLYTDCEMEIGFYQKRQYFCYDGDCFWDGSIAYVNLGVVSIALCIFEDPGRPYLYGSSFAIMQPASGLGVYSLLYYWPRFCSPWHCSPAGFGFEIGNMNKINDNWTPPQFVSMSPHQGERGTTITDVRLYTSNTTFLEKPPDMIDFDPPYVVYVSNINVISDTEIAFDLAITDYAPVGFIDVIVQYGGFVIIGNDAFEVIEKTN
jgi:hypothetical protein